MVSDPNRLDEPLQDDVYSVLADVRREIKELRMEQLQVKEQLFTSLQFLTEMVQMIPSKRLQHNSHGGADVELRKGSPGLHEMHAVPDLLEPEPDSDPMSKKKKGAESGLTRSRDVKFVRGDSMPSSSEFGASIPSFNDLEKRMLRQVSSSQSVRAYKGAPTVRRPSGASLKSSPSKSEDAEMQLVAPQAPAAPSAQQIGQPRQPLQADPPMLQQEIFAGKGADEFGPDDEQERLNPSASCSRLSEPDLDDWRS